VQYPAESTAVAAFGAKDAALYFDYVVPVGLASLGSVLDHGDGRLTASVSFDELPEPAVLLDLFPPPLRTVKHPFLLVNAIQAYAIWTQKIAPGGWAARVVDPTVAKHVAAKVAQDPTDPIMPDLMRQNVGWVEHLQAIDRNGQLAFFGGRPNTAEAEAESVCATLTGLKLVDTSGLTWEQVDAFRRDADNVRKLRRLKLDVFEKYAGKSPSYVKDDVAKRIEDYQEAAKLWGLPLRLAMMHTVLNDKAVAALLASGIGAMFYGEPMAATAAGSTLGALLMGQIGLEVKKRRHHIAEIHRTNALAYLFELQQLAKP
jgi:hypothetical protein